MTTFPYAKSLLALALAGALSIGLGTAQANQQPSSAISLLTQAQGLPAEFRDHFFDVPLAVRVDLDGRFMAEAMLVLSRDEKVQLLEYTDTHESEVSAQVLQQWLATLNEPQPLGDCTKKCANGLLALHYSLANSQLSILTQAAERDASLARFHALPEQGSHGVLLRNQLNLSGGERDVHGTYTLEGVGSVGQWTTTARGQVDRSSGTGGQMQRYRVSDLHADRLVDDRFYRLGYFAPSAQGLTRQPNTLGSRPEGIVGFMFGSNDSLVINDGQASTTPIYVTPNRPATVEVYRDGSLIYTQAVQPGLQTLDTRSLPGGIYEVEVRLIEDGEITSRSEEFVYKPRNWSNPDQRWRYNAYLGQSQDLLSNWQDDRAKSLGAGVMANYLLHPRAVLGLSTERVNDAMQYGTSLDWDIKDNVKLYGNLHHTENQGNGYDLQSIYAHKGGSVVLSHSRSWIETTTGNSVDRLNSRAKREVRETQQNSLSLQQRLDDKNSANLRVNHSTGANSGVGVDLSWVRRGMVMGSDATWRFSVFDRPGSASSGGARNRGVDVSLTMSLGSDGSRAYGSLGSRTGRDGSREHNASLSYQQQLDHGVLRSVTGTLNADSFGVGVGSSAELQGRAMSGSAHLQTSSFNNELSGGLNLQSTVGIGGGAVAMTGDTGLMQSAMVVDVESDYTDLEMQAYDQQGLASTLKPGRNLVPVSAYKSGNLQFDFNGDAAPAAVIQPASASYHLNKGGVAYQKVRIMRTVTVIGRLLDKSGEPLRGAMVINHASRSVSEADGFFSVEMSESTPTLEVRHKGGQQCFLRLDKDRYEREHDVLLVGDQTCTPERVAAAEPAKAPSAKRG